MDPPEPDPPPVEYLTNEIMLHIERDSGTGRIRVTGSLVDEFVKDRKVTPLDWSDYVQESVNFAARTAIEEETRDLREQQKAIYEYIDSLKYNGVQGEIMEIMQGVSIEMERKLAKYIETRFIEMFDSPIFQKRRKRDRMRRRR